MDKENRKLKELLKVGAIQAQTSGGRYLNFGLALALVQRWFGLKFSTVDIGEANHEWQKKFGTLFAGVEDHQVDPTNGFCHTCKIFHSGEQAGLEETLRRKAVRAKDAVEDVATTPRYRDLADVTHHDLRLNTKLWQMTTISQSDIE